MSEAHRTVVSRTAILDMVVEGRLRMKYASRKCCIISGQMNGVERSVEASTEEGCLTKVFEILNGQEQQAQETRPGPMARVLAVHPKATCYGGVSGAEPWVIYQTTPDGTGDKPIIARGKTGAAAWNNAAKALEIANVPN